MRIKKFNKLPFIDRVSPNTWVLSKDTKYYNIYDHLRRSNLTLEYTVNDNIIMPHDINNIINSYLESDDHSGMELYEYISRMYNGTHPVVNIEHLKNHPIQVMLNIKTKLTSVAEFAFTKYSFDYKPEKYGIRQSIEEEFHVSSDAISEQWLYKILTLLDSNQDLVLNSNISVDNRILHIPMIDFLTNDVQVVKNIVHNLLTDTCIPFMVYDSGRSFHAYGETLLSYDEWVKFNGKLLLSDSSKNNEWIDSRWVGHRLEKGSGALRISCSNVCYRKMPSLVHL